MRKIATLVVAAVSVPLIGVGIAGAVSVDQTIKGSTSPTKKGTKKKPRAVKLKIDIATKKKIASEEFATKSATIYFDRNLVFNTKYFKTCKASTVQSNEGKCPKASKVGSGSAQGEALGQVQKLKVSAFNGPKNTLNLHVTGSSPLAIDSVIVGKLRNSSGSYGKKLVVTLPDNLQQPLPGVYATLTSFITTISKKTARKSNNRRSKNYKVKVPYVGLRGCTKKKLKYKGVFVFTDGTKVTATDTSKCR